MATSGILAVQASDPIASRYEALIRIANSVRAQKNPDDLFQILVDELRQVVRFDAIAQFDESANKIRWHLCSACLQPKEKPDEIDREETLASYVYREQRIVSFGTLEGETRFPRSVAILRQAGLRSVCALPLTTAHRRLGSVVIASAMPNAYSEEEVRFCALVADQIALAMDDAVNFRASLRVQERLQLLLDLTNRVVSNLNLRDVLREVSAQIRRVMECDGVGVALPSPEDGKLRIYALDFPGAPAPIQEGFEPPERNESLMRVFRTGDTLVLSREQLQGAPVPVDVDAVIHMPLKGRDAIAGVLSLGKRKGTFDPDDVAFLTQVAHQVAIAIENARTFGEVSELKNKLTQEKLYLEDEIRSELNFEEIVGRSDALRKVLEQIETVAPTDSTVLIYGETGSGKELIARAVHNLSARKANAFVKLNCAAIPTGLLESELFGHERGAFTGAISQRVGRFELANHGTMFLDEIGEIPIELQPKLLRVLQDRMVQRIGGERPYEVDFRLVSATNHDLHTLVADGKFRLDLYYRISPIVIDVPPLRARIDDIPTLAATFLREVAARHGRSPPEIAPNALTYLMDQGWPGNVRELRHEIERAFVFAEDGRITAETLSQYGDSRTWSPSSFEHAQPRSPSGSARLKEAVERVESELVRDAMARHRGNKKRVAKDLGISRSYLYKKLGLSEETQ